VANDGVRVSSVRHSSIAPRAMPVATAALPIANQGPRGNRNMVVGCDGACPRAITISGWTATDVAVKSAEPVPRSPETCHVS
jgi:hypothetical protein